MITKYGGGSRLKQARTKIGLTQKALAAELGLSPAYISLIETERQQISEPIAMKMQSRYGISARWLLYGIGGDSGQSTSNLRTVRDEVGMTQKAMASALGISAQYLGLMERGEQPTSRPVALKMQELFGYSAEWILFSRGPKKIFGPESVHDPRPGQSRLW